MGLVITRKLAEMMRGSIAVESEYGRGSTFTVTLVQGLVFNEDGQSAVPGIGEETAGLLRQFRYVNPDRKKIIDRSWMPYATALVVDDMPVNLLVAQGLLKPYGIKVDTAASGKEAVEKVKAVNEPYHLIFMDHVMPEMDGIETVRIIRAWEEENRHMTPSKSGNIQTEFNLTPIIALTANALVGNTEMFLSKGFNGFLPKPIDLVQLDKVLNHWIKDRQSPETLRRAEDDRNRQEAENAPLSENNSSPVLPAPSANFFIPGIDIKQGIAMSGGTESLYYEVLSTFRTDIEERLPLLQTVPDKDNLRSFITSVHALKSASATIGAAEASTMAAELEKAGRAGDMTFIEKELPVFSKQLTVLAEGIRIRDAAAKEHFPSISHS